MRRRTHDHEAVAAAYLNGQTIREISDNQHILRNTVRKILRTKGLTGWRDDRYGNRPNALPEATVTHIRALRAQGVSYRDVQAMTGVSTGTIARYTKGAA